MKGFPKHSMSRGYRNTAMLSSAQEQRIRERQLGINHLDHQALKRPQTTCGWVVNAGTDMRTEFEDLVAIPRPKTKYASRGLQSKAGQTNFYQTALNFSLNKSRPQSKQEPRLKASLGLPSTSNYLPGQQRPQTSKGSRTINLHGDHANRQCSIENQVGKDVVIKFTKKRQLHPVSAHNSRSHVNPKLVLDSDIDTEFLSLFAN